MYNLEGHATVLMCDVGLKATKQLAEVERKCTAGRTVALAYV